VVINTRFCLHVYIYLYYIFRERRERERERERERDFRAQNALRAQQKRTDIQYKTHTLYIQAIRILRLQVASSIKSHNFVQRVAAVLH